MRACRRYQKIFGGGTLGPRPLGRGGAWLTPQKHASPPRLFPYQISSLYVNPFGCTWDRSKNVGTMGPRPLGMGRGWPLEICFSHLYYLAKFGHSRSNHTSVIMEISARKFWPLKVTLGHWNRYGSIGYIWLPISVPYYYSLSPNVSEINGDIWKKFHPLYLTPPLRGFRWNFVTVVGP